MKQFLVDLLRWLIVLTMPLFLLYGTARLLIDDWYLPGFPTDPYGFTAVQRFELASIAIAYLNRPERAEEVIGMLTNQRLAGTSQLPYAEREISHMLDVKRLTGTLRRLQFVVGVISVGGLVLQLVRRSTRAAASARFSGACGPPRRSSPGSRPWCCWRGRSSSPSSTSCSSHPTPGRSTGATS